MRNAMNDKTVTLDVFCKRHPELAAEARALVKAGAVTLDSDGKVSERLLKTASMVYTGQLDPNVKRRTAAHFVK